MTKRLLILMAALTLVAGACDGDDDDTQAEDTTTQPTEADGGEGGGTELRATLAGPEEGDPDGEGTATLTLDEATGEVCFEVSVSNLDTPTGMHVHRGGEGEAGPVVIPLVHPTSGDGNVDDCVTVEAGLVEGVTASPEGHYVNVHTEPFPDGAIRGQLEG